MQDRSAVLGVMLWVSIAGCQIDDERDDELGVQESAVKTVASACSGDRFPVDQPNPLHCCQDQRGTWHTNDGTFLAHRVYGQPCREEDGVGTNCGVGSNPFKQCYFGPCGSHNEWAVNAAEVYIFHPDSKPDKCGWEIRGIGTCLAGDTCDWYKKGTRNWPETYTDQDLYGATVNTCPYRKCVAGVPTP